MCAHTAACAELGSPIVQFSCSPCVATVYKKKNGITDGYKHKITCQKAQQPSSSQPIPRLKGSHRKMKHTTTCTASSIYMHDISQVLHQFGCQVLWVSDKSSTKCGHQLWWRIDWLKTQHCQDSITIANHGTQDSTGKAHMRKKNYDKNSAKRQQLFAFLTLAAPMIITR